MTYVTLADMKTYLAVDDTDDDTFITLCIGAASALIDQFIYTNYTTASAEARYFTTVWDSDLCRYTVQIDNIADLTALTVTGIDAADYVLHPRNSAVKSYIVFNTGFAGTTDFESTVITGNWR